MGTFDRRSQSGFTLLEVLVSVLILAVGMIGVAGMQLHALHTAQQSGFRTMALHLAADMADRIRARSRQAAFDDHANPYFGAADDASTAAPGATANCYIATCAAAALLLADFAQWQQQISTALPGGRAVICRDSAPWNTSSQAYAWSCDGAAAAPLVIKLGWREKPLKHGSDIPRETDQPPAIVLAVAPATK